MDNGGNQADFTGRTARSKDNQIAAYDSGIHAANDASARYHEKDPDDKEAESGNPEPSSSVEPNIVHPQKPSSTTSDKRGRATSDRDEISAGSCGITDVNETVRTTPSQIVNSPAVEDQNVGPLSIHSNNNFPSKSQLNSICRISIPVIVLGYLTGYLLIIVPIIMNIASIFSVSSGCILLFTGTSLCLAFLHSQNPTNFDARLRATSKENGFIIYPSNRSRANALSAVTIIIFICGLTLCGMSIIKLWTIAPSVDSDVAYIIWGILALLGLLLIALSPLLLLLHSKRERSEENQWYQAQLQAELDLRWQRERQGPDSHRKKKSYESGE